MKAKIWLVLPLVLFYVSLSHASSNLFVPYTRFPTGSWPEAAAIGDVNGDGLKDVVMVTSSYFDPKNDNRLFIFLQNRRGSMILSSKHRTRGMYSPSTVAVGDINHDGRNDIVIGHPEESIEVFLQNKSGRFNNSTLYPTTHSDKIKIADLNNDGLSDVAGMGWESVDVFLQQTDGTLSVPITYPVNDSGNSALEVGDVNDDGLTDIIVMNGNWSLYPNLGVLLQKPDGTFDAPAYYEINPRERTDGMAVGDVNGDHLLDVVVTYGGNDGGIGVFLQNSGGTLDPAVTYPSYDCPTATTIADVNNDGRDDVIVVHDGFVAVGVYLQNEGGTLAPEELYDIPNVQNYNPQALAAGDINGDGLNDLVIANCGSASPDDGLVVLYAYDPATVALLSPEEGETISPGFPVTIQWTAPDEAARFTLYYSKNSGASWQVIQENLTGDSHLWTPSKPVGRRTKCFVKIIAFDEDGKKIGTSTSRYFFVF